MLQLVLLAFLAEDLLKPSAATCFTYDGVDRNSLADAGPNVYTPCASVPGQASMCCRAGSDECRGGFCYNYASDVYWRESCTDETWQDPNCIKLFVNATHDVQITNCSDGRWCYGPDNTGCCQAKAGYYVADGVQTLQDPSQTGTASSSTGAAYSTSNSILPLPSSSSPSNRTSSSRLTAGAIGGIAVGVIVSLIAVMLLGVWLIRRRKSRRNEQDHMKHKELPKPPDMGPSKLQMEGTNHTPVVEIGQTDHVEMST